MARKIAQMQRRDTEILDRIITNLRENLKQCLDYNRQWEEYARGLEALHNEKVDIINRLQAELDAIKGDSEDVIQ
jgi:hypothetical protein